MSPLVEGHYVCGSSAIRYGKLAGERIPRDLHKAPEAILTTAIISAGSLQKKQSHNEKSTSRMIRQSRTLGLKVK